MAGDLPDLVAAFSQRGPPPWLKAPSAAARRRPRAPAAPSPPDGDGRRGSDGAGPLATGLGRDRPGGHHPQRRGAVAPGAARPGSAPSSRRTATGTAARRSPAPRWPEGRLRLAVALVDEGVELRQHDVQGPILLLSECGADAVDAALAYGLTPTLYTAEGIEQFARAARRRGQTTPVHVKVDTGMHRVGARAGRRPRPPARHRRRAAPPVRGAVDALPGGRRGHRRGPRLHRGGSWRSFDRRGGRDGPGRRPSRVLHAANTAGAIAFPRGTLRHGPLRHRPVRLPSRAGGAGGVLRGIGGRDAATGHVVAGPASSRCARWRRENAPPTAACGHCHGARWWRPCRSATPTACRGPSLREAAASSSAGGAAPWRGRSPWTRSWSTAATTLGGPGRRGGAARATGRRGDHGRRVGGAAGHDQLRDPLRHRPEGPPDRRQRSGRIGRIQPRRRD